MRRRAACGSPTATVVFCVWLVIWLVVWCSPGSVASSVEVPPGERVTGSLSAEPGATNVTLSLMLSEGTGPLAVDLCREGDAECHSVLIEQVETSYELTVDLGTSPPVNAGNYVYWIHNKGPDLARVQTEANVVNTPEETLAYRFINAVPQSLSAAPVVFSTNHVAQAARLLSAEAGVRIAHPRVSDLSLHLLSPAGTRALLARNRGGDSTEGMGRDNLFTNDIPFSAEGGAEVYTNVINTGVLAGSMNIDWSFYSLGDRMVVYYGDREIMDTGVVSWNGSTNLVFGPGDSTMITIVMNPGNNPEPDTAWDYNLEISMAEHIRAFFTDDTAKTTTAIQHAVPPFTNANYIGSNAYYAEDIFYLPESTLRVFAGENPLGNWLLEIADSTTGDTNRPQVLLSWELRLVLENPGAKTTALTPETRSFRTVAPRAILPFSVEVPEWANRVTNSLLAAGLELNVWHNPDFVPEGTNLADSLVIGPAKHGSCVLEKAGSPPLVVGKTYYLGVENTNPIPVRFGLVTEFDVASLGGGVSSSGSLEKGRPHYFYYDATVETAVSFQLYNLTDNADMVVSRTAYPGMADYVYGSFNLGTNSEEVTVTVDSAPVALSSGRWYVGVLGPTNTAYSVRAVAHTNAIPRVHTLTNAVPFVMTNSPLMEGSNTCFRFAVSSDALRGEFEISDASGAIALAVKKGFPPPDVNSFDYLAADPGSSNQVVVLLDCSTPVALSSGEWYATAINLSGGDVTCTVKASQWTARGTEIVVSPPEVTDGSVCLTWTSLPGIDYFLRGTVDVGSSSWEVVSPAITACEYTTTYCLPQPVACKFFQVGKGRPPSE